MVVHMVSAGEKTGNIDGMLGKVAKTGAEASPDLVERFAAWLPLYKISQIGLQYHGKNSKNPEPDFTTNIKTLCPRLRRSGTLESIVYFCPFRAPKGNKAGRASPTQVMMTGWALMVCLSLHPPFELIPPPQDSHQAAQRRPRPGPR
jgi:hypothetical protein